MFVILLFFLCINILFFCFYCCFCFNSCLCWLCLPFQSLSVICCCFMPLFLSCAAFLCNYLCLRLMSLSIFPFTLSNTNASPCLPIAHVTLFWSANYLSVSWRLDGEGNWVGDQSALLVQPVHQQRRRRGHRLKNLKMLLKKKSAKCWEENSQIYNV